MAILIYFDHSQPSVTWCIYRIDARKPASQAWQRWLGFQASMCGHGHAPCSAAFLEWREAEWMSCATRSRTNHWLPIGGCLVSNGYCKVLFHRIWCSIPHMNLMVVRWPHYHPLLVVHTKPFHFTKGLNQHWGSAAGHQSHQVHPSSAFGGSASWECQQDASVGGGFVAIKADNLPPLKLFCFGGMEYQFKKGCAGDISN